MIRFREAQEHEGELISHLALESKAYWNYSEEFLQACVEVLTIDAQYIKDNYVFVLEEEDDIVGFFALVTGEETRLDFLFIHPKFIGQGFGSLLWQYIVIKAKELGIKSFIIDSDPNAKAFYEKMGAVHIGESPSRVLEDRRLPLMKMTITANGN